MERRGWELKINTDGANGVDLGEGGLRVPKAAGGEVEEAVALVTESGQVATLVPALVRRVYRQRLVLLHVLQEPP